MNQTPTWTAAQLLRDGAMSWLPDVKVELDKDPSRNIGGLHAKAAEIREKANKVRDVVYGSMAINMALRREAAEAAWTYEQARASAAKDPANEALLSKLKTKDEREAAVQQIVATQYQSHVDAGNRLEEWDQFLKMVNLIYYSLTHSREDLTTQVNIIKQQMFNGEVKPNEGLSKLSSIADLLGAEAKSLFSAPAHGTDPSLVDGPVGEVEWCGVSPPGIK